MKKEKGNKRAGRGNDRVMARDMIGKNGKMVEKGRGWRAGERKDREKRWMIYM